MKLVRRSLPFWLLFLVIGLHSAPTFGQTPPNKTPHLAYGQSMEITLKRDESVLLWLDVQAGDVFTVRVVGGIQLTQYLKNSPTVEILPLSWNQWREGSGWVFLAQDSGPYLWTLMGDKSVTVTLEQGDTLSIDRGSIALGDTVTGTGSEEQLDAYTIDLPANSDFTIHVYGSGSVQLPDLRDVFQIRWTDFGFHIYYKVPAELAGQHQMFLRFFTAGNYTLQIIAGNDSWQYGGILEPNRLVSEISHPPTHDYYEIQANAGDVVTFVLEYDHTRFDSLGSIALYTARGTYSPRTTDRIIEGGDYVTFHLDEEGPYYLYIQTTEPYTLTMLQGPYLEGIPLIKVGDSLEIANTGATWYVLEASERSWVTIQTIASDGTSINRLYLESAIGKVVLPIARFIDNSQGILRSLFYLQGPAPYRLEISGNVAYTLSVVDGDAVRTDAGEITVGQSVEGTADIGQTIVYTLPSVEAGQTVAIRQSGTSGFSVYDVNGEWVEYFHFYFLNPDDPSGNLITYAAYQLDGLCPCELQLVTNRPNYTLEVMPIAPDVFPDAQPLNLGEAVSGDTGNALLLPYTFQADTDGSKLYLEVQAPSEEDDPRYLLLDHSQTEVGEGYLVQHYPLYFPGEYTLRIKNLHGPYTLTVELQ